MCRTLLFNRKSAILKPLLNGEKFRLKSFNIINGYHFNNRFTLTLKVELKVKVTSTTSPANLLRPGMAGLPALIRPKFHFKNVRFDQNGLFEAPFIPCSPT